MGLSTGFLAYRYISEKSDAQSGPVASVVVAKSKIASGTKITQDMLKTVDMPVSLIPANALRDLADAVGKYAIQDIWPERVVVQEEVANQRTGSDLPYKVPEGFRAVTVAVNAVSGVSGHIKPGHYVDVLLSYKPSERPNHVTVTTILQKVLVLAVGQDLQRKDGVQPASEITLALSPNDAQILTLAENIGKVKLVLRPAGDESLSSLPVIGTETLIR